MKSCLTVVITSSIVVSQRKTLRPVRFGSFSFVFDCLRLGLVTARTHFALGRGAITRSKAGKFTFLNATMVYLDNPVAE